jgi:phosphatidylglycerol---prolipoprotein diacylglyceryl transferase
VHPVAFHFGSFTVHWYGIFVAVGFLLGIWTASRRGVRDGLAPEKIADSATWLVLSAMIGARILHVISYWDEEFAGKPLTEIFMIQRGGLVYYGGFIGGVIAVLIYTRLHKIPLWKFGDAVAPSIALGHAFGRIGCLMTGCCYGKACDLPWAVHFPFGHETHRGPEATPVHPVQIYEALLNFALYGFLAWLYRRKKFDGQIFATYLLCYAVLRSFVELFRADYRQAQYVFGFFSPGQVVSIFVFAAGLFLVWRLSRYPLTATPQKA